MRKLLTSLLVLAMLAACGGTAGPYGPMPSVPIEAPDVKPDHPVYDPIIAVADGQSNQVAYDYALAEQFVSRVRADAAPGQDVYLVKAAISGTKAEEWLPGGRGDALLKSQYKYDVPTDYMLTLQGEANRDNPQQWLNQRLAIIQHQRNIGIIGKDTKILIGEVAHNGVTDGVNAYMGQLAERAGATIVSSVGLETVPSEVIGVHFTKPDLVEYGNRFYEATK